MSAILSLLQSRLLRPVFVTLGIALLVQVLVAVALTRSTVTALEADLDARLGTDSQKLSAELEQAAREVKGSLEGLSASTRQRLTAGLSPRLKDEQAQVRATLEKSLMDSANDMAQLLAAVAPRAMWDSDVPTLSELGLPGFTAMTWGALVAPAGTPAPIVERLNRAANQAVASKEMAENFAQTYAQPFPGTPADLKTFMAAEIAKWAKAVAASGAQVD